MRSESEREPKCPECGAREWASPPDATVLFSARDVVCVKCGHRTTQNTIDIEVAEDEVD